MCQAGPWLDWLMHSRVMEDVTNAIIAAQDWDGKIPCFSLAPHPLHSLDGITQVRSSAEAVAREMTSKSTESVAKDRGQRRAGTHKE